MSNLSIEAQVAKLCRDAQSAMFAESGGEDIATLTERLRTELKAIVGTSCHPVVDRGVEALQSAAVWGDTDSGSDAVRSIVRCVTNDEIDRASIAFCRAMALELSHPLGVDLSQEEIEKIMAPEPIFALLTFVDSESDTYEYQSMDNLEQSEMSHALWLEYGDRCQSRSMPEPTEADRLLWKTAFRAGFSEGSKAAKDDTEGPLPQIRLQPEEAKSVLLYVCVTV